MLDFEYADFACKFCGNTFITIRRTETVEVEYHLGTLIRYGSNAPWDYELGDTRYQDIERVESEEFACTKCGAKSDALLGLVTPIAA